MRTLGLVLLLWGCMGEKPADTDTTADTETPADSDTTEEDTENPPADTDGSTDDTEETPSDVYSCDLRSTAGYCQEYQDLDDELLAVMPEDICPSAQGGVWAMAGCPRDNAVGGCQGPPLPDFEVVLVNWFYADTLTAELARENCEQSGGTFIEP